MRKPQAWFIYLLLCSLAVLSSELFAESPTSPPPTLNVARPAAPSKPKLTPDQQRGFKLLKAAQAEAAGFEPAMRAAVLWRISGGYLAIDKPKAIALLKDAFRSAGSAETKSTDVPCFIDPPDGCQPRPYLQLEILSELVSLSPDDGEQLVLQDESKLRKYLMGSLISRFVEQKKLEHAEELLTRLADEDDFPYYAASKLMLESKSSEQRLAIFNLALRNFSSFGDPEYFASDEDLGTLVIRFWDHLPAPVVLEAIDHLLERAKTESEKSDNHVSFATQKGNVVFSLYEYRVFELVPVLRELESARAESLLREQSQVRTSLERYPQGLRSLNPLYRDTPATAQEQEETFPMISSGNPREDLGVQQSMDQWQLQMFAKQDEIRKEASRNPKQALQLALALPMWGPMGPGVGSPRARNLQNVAEVTAKKDADTASKALDELRKVLQEYKPRYAAHYLLEIVDDYLAMGDKERAARTLEEGMKLAEKLYAADTDSSDPNLALKAQWPSAAFWQKLVMVSARISPQLPEQLMSQTADQEIRTLQKVAFALALVDAKKVMFPVIEWHKAGKNSMGSDF